MANPEHLAVLEQGMEIFRSWRLNNPALHPDLSGANLQGMNLAWGYFRFANMENANLEGANLSSSDLTMALLDGASLKDTCLHDARLRSTRLREADLQGAKLYATELLDLQLGSVKNLSEARVLGPCSIDVFTLHNSGGVIPSSFLRECGVPDFLISMLPRLIERPARHSSCFISFNEKDEEIASRIYESLRLADVSCWRWKEDARWGGWLRREIDAAVWKYDRLVVILSKDSLNSMPVIREIHRALQKEERAHSQGRTADVLFPIRIDDAVFDWSHELRADVTEKMVANFSDWRLPERYDEAFQRLLSALTKEVLLNIPGRYYPIHDPFKILTPSKD
jgi:uncharacterized protein YjbI with pentapeptide repeats